MSESANTTIIFDITWFTTFLVLQVTPFFFPRAIELSAGYLIFTLLVGGTMLFSKRIMPISKVGKMLHWFALNVLKPRTEYNHIIWGLFILIFGIIAFFFADKPTEQELTHLDELNRNPETWLMIAAVFALNIFVGILTARKHKK